MIVIFDLDDTLYDEKTFVFGGFLAVSKYLEEEYGISAKISYANMINLLEKKGRGNIFNIVLDEFYIYNKKTLNTCINIYRHHEPQLSLFSEAKLFLLNSQEPLYLVTDGHKIVQRNKVNALNIKNYFKKIYLTHQYGRKYAKPSTYCFAKIKSIEKCRWSDMVYIGDNPHKDFVNLKPLGVNTIRVLVGDYRDVIVDPSYDAEHKIKNLSFLSNKLMELQ